MAVESTWQLILVLCVLVVVIVFLLKPTYISTPWRYNIPVRIPSKTRNLPNLSTT
jgi:hypothetical protein